jgi:hypothetical protein
LVRYRKCLVGQLKVERGERLNDRQNTIVCCFDLRTPRVTAFHIHEWINETLKLAEKDVCIIQIDGPRRRAYIKFTLSARMQTVCRIRRDSWSSNMTTENCLR